MELLIRPAGDNDRMRIMRIIGEARARMGARGSAQWQDGYPASADIVRDLARGSGTVAVLAATKVAARDERSGKENGEAGTADGLRSAPEERIVAYAAIVFDGEPAYDAIEKGSWSTEAPYVVVHRLAVADEALRRGVATALLRYAEAEATARGIRCFRIDTAEDNHPMREALGRLGFRRCGLVRYRSGERIAYEKSL